MTKQLELDTSFEYPLNKDAIKFYGRDEKEQKLNETVFDLSIEKDKLENILKEISKIVNNKDISGIEAKLMIIDILNEMKEGNDNK